MPSHVAHVMRFSVCIYYFFQNTRLPGDLQKRLSNLIPIEMVRTKQREEREKRTEENFISFTNPTTGSSNSLFTSARRHDKTCFCTFQVYSSHVDTAKHLSPVSKEISEISVTGKLCDLTVKASTDVLWQGTVERYR